MGRLEFPFELKKDQSGRQNEMAVRSDRGPCEPAYRKLLRAIVMHEAHLDLPAAVRTMM